MDDGHSELDSTDGFIVAGAEPAEENPEPEPAAKAPDRDERGRFKAQEPEEDEPPEPDAAADDDHDDDDDGQHGDLPPGLKARLRRANRQRDEAAEAQTAAERRAQEAEAKAAAAQQRAENLAKAMELDPDDFEDYDAYQTAYQELVEPPAAAKAEEAKPEGPKSEAAPAGEITQQQAGVMAAEIRDALEAGGNADLWARATDANSGLSLSLPMVAGIADEIDPAPVIQHLLDNPAVGQRIQLMGSADRQRRAIERLSADLAAGRVRSRPAPTPPPQRQSRAPEPIEPVRGQNSRTGSAAEAAANGDFSAFRQRREADLAGEDDLWV